MQYNNTFVSPEHDQIPGPLLERVGVLRSGVGNLATFLDNSGWRVSEAQQQQNRLDAQAKVAEAVAANVVTTDNVVDMQAFRDRKNAAINPATTSPAPNEKALLQEINSIHDSNPNQGAASVKVPA